MNKLVNVESSFFFGIGAIGSLVASALGGFDKLIIGLLICMSVDYLTGLIVAIVFKNSPKTETGAAESNAGFKGFIKKVFILLIIVVITQVDGILNSNGFIRNMVIIGFMANECLSIVENVGLTGLELPPALISAIDILKKKSEIKGDGNFEK